MIYCATCAMVATVTLQWNVPGLHWLAFLLPFILSWHWFKMRSGRKSEQKLWSVSLWYLRSHMQHLRKNDGGTAWFSSCSSLTNTTNPPATCPHPARALTANRSLSRSRQWPEVSVEPRRSQLLAIVSQCVFMCSGGTLMRGLMGGGGMYQMYQLHQCCLLSRAFAGLPTIKLQCSELLEQLWKLPFFNERVTVLVILSARVLRYSHWFHWSSGGGSTVMCQQTQQRSSNK